MEGGLGSIEDKKERKSEKKQQSGKEPGVIKKEEQGKTKKNVEKNEEKILKKDRKSTTNKRATAAATDKTPKVSAKRESADAVTESTASFSKAACETDGKEKLTPPKEKKPRKSTANEGQESSRRKSTTPVKDKGVKAKETPNQKEKQKQKANQQPSQKSSTSSKTDATTTTTKPTTGAETATRTAITNSEAKKDEKKTAAGFYLPTFSDSDDEEENGAGLIIDLGGGTGGAEADDAGTGQKESSVDPNDGTADEDESNGNGDGPCKLNADGVTIFVCAHCEETFETMSDRRKHVLGAHEDTGKHECDVCQKNFNSKASLAVHKKSAHSKVGLL